MGIKDWHGGKIALIWVIAPIVILVLVATADEFANDGVSFLVKALLVLALTAVFTTPFVLTWKWLSGKESKPKS